MDRQSLKILGQLEHLRKLREQRAHDALVSDTMRATEISGRVDKMTGQMAAMKSEALAVETTAMTEVVGKALSLADLSRLQSRFVAEDKRIAKLASALETADLERQDAARAVEVSREQFKKRQQASFKIGTAYSEAKRKAARRQIVLDELVSDETFSTTGRGR